MKTQEEIEKLLKAMRADFKVNLTTIKLVTPLHRDFTYLNKLESSIATLLQVLGREDESIQGEIKEQ